MSVPRFVSLRVTRDQYGNAVSLERDDNIMMDQNYCYSSSTRLSASQPITTTNNKITINNNKLTNKKDSRKTLQHPPWVHPIMSRGTQTNTAADNKLDTDEQPPAVIEMIQPQWGNNNILPVSVSDIKPVTQKCIFTDSDKETSGDKFILSLFPSPIHAQTPQRSVMTCVQLERSNASAVRWSKTLFQASSVHSSVSSLRESVEKKQEKEKEEEKEEKQRNDNNTHNEPISLLHNKEKLDEMLGICTTGMDEESTHPESNMRDDSKEMDREKISELPLYSPSLNSLRNEEVGLEENNATDDNYDDGILLSVSEEDYVNVKEYRPEFILDETLERNQQEEEQEEEINIKESSTNNDENYINQEEKDITTSVIEVLRTELQYSHSCIEQQQQQFIDAIRESTQHQGEIVEVVKKLVETQNIENHVKQQQQEEEERENSLNSPESCTPLSLAVEKESQDAQNEKNSSSSSSSSSSNSDNNNSSCTDNNSDNEEKEEESKKEEKENMQFLPSWHRKPPFPREASLARNISHYLAKKLNDMHMNNTQEGIINDFSLSSAITIPPVVSNSKSLPSKESTAPSNKEGADPLTSFYELRSAYYRVRHKE